MAGRPNKVICAVCDRFEPQAWRKTMCKNCFHTLPEHDASATQETLETTFDISVSYDAEVVAVNEPATSGCDNILNVNLYSDGEGKTETGDLGVGTQETNEPGASRISDGDVTETVSISLPRDKIEPKIDSCNKSGSVSAAVKIKQSALLNTKSRLVGKGLAGNDKKDNNVVKIWNKQNDDRESAIGGKAKRSEMPKVGRFGKTSEGVDIADGKAKSSIGSGETESQNSPIKSSIPVKRSSVSSEEEESQGKQSPRKLSKDRPSGISSKSDSTRKVDTSLKIRRNNSNTLSGANKEETLDNKGIPSKQKNTFSINKGKPSTPPLPRQSSRESKASQGKGHTSPKSSPKLSGHAEADSYDVNELKSQIEQLEKRCECQERTNSELACTVQGMMESEKRDKDSIERFQKQIIVLTDQYDNLKTAKSELEKSKALERELRSIIATKQNEIQKQQRLCEETKRDGDRLRDENADLQLEIRETRQEMEEMYDQFRESEVDEFRDLQKELEITAKNCRLLQFKLRKCERKSDKAERERFEYETKIKELQGLFQDQDAKAYIKALEGDMSRIKGETVHLQDELDIAEEKRIRLDDENRKLQEILEKTDKKQFRMEMEIDKLHDQLEDLRRQTRDGVENSDDESSQRKILDANQIWRL